MYALSLYPSPRRRLFMILRRGVCVNPLGAELIFCNAALLANISLLVLFL